MSINQRGVKKMDYKEYIPDIKGYIDFGNGNIQLVRTIKDDNHMTNEEYNSQVSKDEEQRHSEVKYSKEQDEDNETKRGKIKCFSLKSRARMAWVLSTTKAEFKYMSTLTYGRIHPKSNKVISRHRNSVLVTIKRMLLDTEYEHIDRDRIKGYFWFTEFQKRGAVHHHIMITHKVDSNKILNNWTKHNVNIGNDERKIVMVHQRTDERGYKFIMQKEKIKGGLKRYGVKYGLKMKQKIPPIWFNGRFYGYSRNIKNDEKQEFVECTEYELRFALGNHRCNKYDVLPKYILGAFR